MEQPIIHCQGLSKRYGSLQALDNLDLTVETGRIIGLLGPNGSGKTTLIKILCGLIQKSAGSVTIDGHEPDVYTKSLISYLPDRMYFNERASATELLRLFQDFYADFDRQKAEAMCASLGIPLKQRIKSMSKGTKEKMQLVLVMSRKAKLYLLDEPIAGVDPAARDFILNTILTNYNESGTVIISTHLIADIEQVLDEAIFLQNGHIVLHEPVDDIRSREGKSVDALFREVFRAQP